MYNQDQNQYGGQYGYNQVPGGQPQAQYGDVNYSGQTGQPQAQYGDANYNYQQQQPAQSYPQQVPQHVMEQQAPLPAAGIKYDPIAVEEVSDQMKFVRKVYSILAVQLAITAGWVAAVRTNEGLKHFVFGQQALMIVAIVGSIGLMCAIICCFGRVAPLNMILLAAFTVCEAYMVAAITASPQYSNKVVCMAALATALVTISLTIYAMRTKTSIQVFAALAFVVYLAMLPLMIIGICVGLGGLYTLYCCLGLIFYSLYLIIDTIIICGKEKHNGIAMDHNDYVIGALMLYIDIIMIFLYILRLLGGK